MHGHEKKIAAMNELIDELDRVAGKIKQQHASNEGAEMKAEGMEEMLGEGMEDSEIGESGLMQDAMHKDSPEMAAKEGHSMGEEEMESPAEVSAEDMEYIRGKLSKQKKGLPMGKPV